MSESSPAPKRKRKIWLWIAIALGVVTFACGLRIGWPQILFELGWGWISFFGRTLNHVIVRWDGVLIFIVGTLLIVGLLHWLLCWLYRAVNDAPKSGATGRRAWRLKWTVLIVATIELAFVAGISMIGATHQTAWLMRSDEPWYGKSFRYNNISVETQLRFEAFELLNFESAFRQLPRDSENVSWIVDALRNSHYSRETENLDLTLPWNAEANRQSFTKPHPSYLNHRLIVDSIVDERGYPVSHYAGNRRIFASVQKVSSDDLLDGASNTLLIGEINSGFLPWASPGNVRDVSAPLNSAQGFGEAIPGQIMVVTADASVKVFDTEIDPTVLKQLDGRIGKPNRE